MIPIVLSPMFAPTAPVAARSVASMTWVVTWSASIARSLSALPITLLLPSGPLVSKALLVSGVIVVAKALLVVLLTVLAMTPSNPTISTCALPTQFFNLFVRLCAAILTQSLTPISGLPDASGLHCLLGRLCHSILHMCSTKTSRHAPFVVSRLVPLCLTTWPRDERDLEMIFFYPISPYSIPPFLTYTAYFCCFLFKTGLWIITCHIYSTTLPLCLGNQQSNVRFLQTRS